MSKKIEFKPVNSKISFPELEEKIIQFWKENKIFEKSVDQRSEDNTWTILDGPPFITGLPHYGSLLSSIPKDIYPRYMTMRGKRVRRVWGWDCHGLPAENKVENKLGIVRKKDIEEKVGIKKFIDECKLYVSEVSSEWEWYVDHIGRWVDFKNAYKTMDNSYMESVMWVFSQMYKKGYIYKGLRVSLYCPHCSTPISNFEVAMDSDNYKEVTEPANVYKYKVKGENAFFLAWSTTPWNKLATPALAVNPKLAYVQVQQGDEQYILAKNTLNILNEDQKYKIIKEMPGKDLIGKEFEPHYDFFEVEKGKRAFVVIPGDFVTGEDGTGIVTIAAYGEDDLRVMQSENIQIVLHVDDEGVLKDEVPNWGGMYYLKVNKLVNQDLLDRGLMYKEEQHTHTVPTCWRCHTRLMYAPQDAWYVDIQTLKPKLLEHNKYVNWIPEHFKDGRFAKSVEFAPDWCISRSRYWGSPVPVWECSCGERFVPESIAELEQASGSTIKDLHKPEVDEISITCKKCGASVKRVSEVLDSWIEAGSAPFAERHYPFEKDLVLDKFFPPDFIEEYTGQIRAWFYVLHVLATGLSLYSDSKRDKLAENVLVTGVVLGTDGRKMSKNFGNYPDPKEMIQKYGGDALRLYLMGSSVMNGEDMKISEADYQLQVRSFLMTYWNIYNFFVSYAVIDGWLPSDNEVNKSDNVLDQWILSRMWGSIHNITENGYDKFNSPEIVGLATIFVVNDLSGWYVRRIRDRVGPSVADGIDKQQAYQTLWTILTTYTKVLAPVIPFISEEIYKNLTGDESVHLSLWPDYVKNKLAFTDDKLEKQMEIGMALASTIHAFRKEHAIKVRIPIKKLSYNGPIEISSEVMRVILEEVNVYELTYSKSDSSTYKIEGDTSDANQDFEAGFARELIRQVQEERKELQTSLDEYVIVSLPEWPQKFEEEIMKKALIKSLTKGEFKVVKNA